MQCGDRFRQLTFCVAALLLSLAGSKPSSAEGSYAWLKSGAPQAAETLAMRIAPPEGFERIQALPGSFASWLRGLPMKPAGAPVLTFSGAPKWRQDVHVAVVDIDVGTRDLQQCADAIMRLRGEWLYGAGRGKDIAFNDTDGKRLRFASKAQQDYPSFRKYMNVVFAYAGTYSLDLELKAVPLSELAIGDVFIKGGFPGHAVLVADVVVNPATGAKKFLLIQSYMPAQEMHILKNPSAKDGSPWYDLDPHATDLKTPEWLFKTSALKRWPS